MKKSLFTTEHIIAILQEHAVGVAPANLLRRQGISRQTFYGWKRQYGNLQVPAAKCSGGGGRKYPPQTPRRRPSPQSPDLQGRVGKRVVTTGERRAVVQRFEAQYAVRQRYACRALGFGRSVMRFVPQRPIVNALLREQLVALAAEHSRWGVPRLHWRLRRDGWLVNYKRVERLYRLEGLAVRRRKRKRLAVPRVPRPAALGPNDTWSLDFVSDQLSDGRRFRCLTLIDSSTRECLAINVAHSLPSTAVITTLEAVIAVRERPTFLSLDSGSEFRSSTFDAWAADRGIAPPFIQRASPSKTRTSSASTGSFATSA